MRIDSNLPANLVTEGRNERRTQQNRMESSGDGSVDGVNRSVDRYTIGALEAAAKQVPDVRTERVQALQQAIRNGQYRVSADKIADAMLADGALGFGR